MTQTRLNELMKKVSENSINLNDLAEICGSLLESNSRHSKEIKTKIKELEDQIFELSEKLDMILENQNPAFGIIVDDEEEDEDEEDD